MLIVILAVTLAGILACAVCSNQRDNTGCALCRFHVYQYMMYTLQMWNSYLFVASLDVVVVLLAGFISIFSLRRSQKAIEKVRLTLTALMQCTA